MRFLNHLSLPPSQLANQPGGNRTLSWLAALTILSIPLAIWLDGYAIATLWRWFVTRATGLAPISVPLAMGLALFLRATLFVTVADPSTEDDPIVRIGRILGVGFGRPLGALLFGWVLLLFM